MNMKENVNFVLFLFRAKIQMKKIFAQSVTNGHSKDSAADGLGWMTLIHFSEDRKDLGHPGT